MAQLSRSSGRLAVKGAVQDGWRAFRRAPWPFVQFALISGGLTLLFRGLGNVRGLPVAEQLPLPLLLLMVLGGVVGDVVVQLWSTIGMIRGAWLALEGERPALDTFLRWDGRASKRLLLAQLCLLVLLLPVAIPFGILGVSPETLPALLSQPPYLFLFLGLTVLAVYLAVGQQFLAWLAVAQGPGPGATLSLGQQVVNRTWGQALLLLLLEVLLLLAGALLCGLGLLVAQPLVVCIATAAYRQLFGGDDRTGALAPPPSLC